MRFIASLIAGLLLVVPVVTAESASASRPIVGYHYKDECKNIKGVQPIYTLFGTGRYVFDTSTKRPNDCVLRVTKH